MPLTASSPARAGRGREARRWRRLSEFDTDGSGDVIRSRGGRCQLGGISGVPEAHLPSGQPMGLRSSF